MKITLNGIDHEIDTSSNRISVTDFVSTLDLGHVPVLVELNGEAILTREFDHHTIEEGSVVEVVRMVAGG
ncbi:MAG: sulfur carrier protein ThiS [Verrucomicrobiota bacterium]